MTPTTVELGELAAFVVHWKNPDACARTVAALRRQTVPLRITVIDNGSPDALLPRFEEERQGGIPVELVRIEGNAGYGPALNRVLGTWLERGAGRFAVVCPHDALPRPDCVERIVRAILETPRSGLASAEYGDARAPGYTLLRGYDLYPAVRGNGWCPAEYPNGTLFVVTRECLEAIGLFDERYFAYGEEFDLGRRALAAGYSVGQVWGAVVENPGRVASSETVWYLNLRNSLLASYQRDGLGAAALRSALTVTRGVLEVARGVNGPATPGWAVRVRAVRDFWLRRFGPPPSL